MEENIYLVLEKLNNCILELKQYAHLISDEELSGKNGILKKIWMRFLRGRQKEYVVKQTNVNVVIEKSLMDIYQMQVLMLNELERIRKNNQLLYSGKLDEFKKSKKRVIQIVSAVKYGDAVGNDVIAIQSALKEAGYTTGIFAEFVSDKIETGVVFPFDMLPQLREDDIIIYHFAAEDHFKDFIKNVPCKVVLRYHNVTPPEFFEGYDEGARQNTALGLEEIKELADAIDYGLVVSEFNRDDLVSYGYKCPMDIAPILIRFDDYKQVPNQEVVNNYSDGKHNILFVGRVAPNKKIEDVISAFAEYKKTYDKEARLFLVGGCKESDVYYQKLMEHIARLQVQDVIFSGHIAFDEILAYYTVADLFLCMSEHEGFCVPLVEAMFFEVPIIAYNACAVPNTLGGSGCLVESKDFEDIAKKMNSILMNRATIAEMIQNQNRRLADFDNQVVTKEILSCLKRYMND